jgi:hypothetical protein
VIDADPREVDGRSGKKFTGTPIPPLPGKNPKISRKIFITPLAYCKTAKTLLGNLPPLTSALKPKGREN